ncbi:MAG TPA: AbrB/MazE/SpoVT family DNA-binding domain-containing protein [Acidobacteriaceae bacterium]|nr:AbrB/MazE/SpoVT family DNA-binding domain-containing protein [Acidobacteriaceae bacterium]
MRPKNQLTVPHEIARAAGLQPGSRLIVEYRGDEPAVIRMRVLRESYAGAIPGMYGRNGEEVAAYLRGESDSWGQ